MTDDTQAWVDLAHCLSESPLGQRCNLPAGHAEHMHKSVGPNESVMWHDEDADVIPLATPQHFFVPYPAQFRVPTPEEEAAARERAKHMTAVYRGRDYAMVIEVMDKHIGAVLDVGTRWQCQCGERGTSSREKSAGRGHLEHVAEMIAAEIEEYYE